jgi:hypothetical protein
MKSSRAPHFRHRFNGLEITPADAQKLMRCFTSTPIGKGVFTQLSIGCLVVQPRPYVGNSDWRLFQHQATYEDFSQALGVIFPEYTRTNS